MVKLVLVVTAIICVCVCVCVGGWVGVGGCVRPSTEKASSVWISWTTSEQINNVVLETFISYGKSLHRYCRMKHLTLVTLSLTSVRVAFRTWGLQLPLSDIAFSPRYIIR